VVFSIVALVSGNFLHISTTIVFESSPEHHFNARKLRWPSWTRWWRWGGGGVCDLDCLFLSAKSFVATFVVLLIVILKQFVVRTAVHAADD
jgi:hypothetical protein